MNAVNHLPARDRPERAVTLLSGVTQAMRSIRKILAVLGAIVLSLSAMVSDGFVGPANAEGQPARCPAHEGWLYNFNVAVVDVDCETAESLAPKVVKDYPYDPRPWWIRGKPDYRTANVHGHTFRCPSRTPDQVFCRGDGKEAVLFLKAGWGDPLQWLLGSEPSPRSLGRLWSEIFARSALERHDGWEKFQAAAFPPEMRIRLTGHKTSNVRVNWCVGDGCFISMVRLRIRKLDTLDYIVRYSWRGKRIDQYCRAVGKSDCVKRYRKKTGNLPVGWVRFPNGRPYTFPELTGVPLW